VLRSRSCTAVLGRRERSSLSLRVVLLLLVNFFERVLAFFHSRVSVEDAIPSAAEQLSIAGVSSHVGPFSYVQLPFLFPCCTRKLSFPGNNIPITSSRNALRKRAFCSFSPFPPIFCWQFQASRPIKGTVQFSPRRGLLVSLFSHNL